MSIFSFLKNDHKKLISVMNRIIEIGDKVTNEKTDLFDDFKELFSRHDDIEDDILYPTLLDFKETNLLIRKAYQAHHLVKVGILELKLVPYTSKDWFPKFSILRDNILLHIKEEEKNIFVIAQKMLTPTDLNELDTQLQARI